MQTDTAQTCSSEAAADPDRAILAQFALPAGKSRIEVINTDSPHASVFAIWGEDHTLGNVLRHMVSLDEHVAFCGYTMPHPSLSKFHIRIQTDGTKTAIEALEAGLVRVREAAEFVRARFQEEADTFMDSQ